MSAGKHTPGPLVRDTAGGIKGDIRAANGRWVALCWGHGNGDNYRPEYRAECGANADRIVACWNACIDIETDELERIASTGGMLGLREDVARLAQQRDELLAALEQIKDHPQAHYLVCRIARAAIARVAIAKANRGAS